MTNFLLTSSDSRIRMSFPEGVATYDKETAEMRVNSQEMTDEEKESIKLIFKELVNIILIN